MISISTQQQLQTSGRIAINGRFRGQRITGVQRYAHEITLRLPLVGEILAPASGKGSAGHLWEQMVLPVLCRGRLLWNPNASGPLAYANQIVTFHDLFPIEHPEWYSAAYSHWYGIVMRRMALQAKHLIAVSSYTKSRLQHLLGIDSERISVVHNGCHLKGPASAEQVREAATALRLPTQRYILSLSSMDRRKNTAAIVEAWAAIYEYLPDDVWLVLAGPPADPSIFGRQVATACYPRVFFTGYVPEEHLCGLYTGASLFAFPSLAEGFGFPLLEAMACGVRCIASRSTSLPEIGGDLVDYVDPTNTAQLANLLYQRLMECKKVPEPFEAAIERALGFSWDTAAWKTMHILQTACAEQPLIHTGETVNVHDGRA